MQKVQHYLLRNIKITYAMIQKDIRRKYVTREINGKT